MKSTKGQLSNVAKMLTAPCGKVPIVRRRNKVFGTELAQYARKIQKRRGRTCKNNQWARVLFDDVHITPERKVRLRNRDKIEVLKWL